MRFRLEGTPEEVEQAVEAMREVFEVQEVSGFYPNRGQSVFGRVYVTAKPILRSAIQAEATRINPTKPRVNQGKRRELET